MAIVRKQSDEKLSCDSREFDQYVCMTYDDLSKLYDTYALGCEVWKPGKKKGEATKTWSSPTEKESQ